MVCGAWLVLTAAQWCLLSSGARWCPMPLRCLPLPAVSWCLSIPSARQCPLVPAVQCQWFPVTHSLMPMPGDQQGCLVVPAAGCAQCCLKPAAQWHLVVPTARWCPPVPGAWCLLLPPSARHCTVTAGGGWYPVPSVNDAPCLSPCRSVTTIFFYFPPATDK